MIKQIFFDVGKVILTRRTTDASNIAKVIGVTEEKYSEIHEKVISDQTKEQHEQFWSIRTLEDEYRYIDDFNRRVCTLLDIKYDDALIRKMTDCRIKADFVINEGVIDTLTELKKKNQLSILSNALPSRRHFDLKIENLIEFFDPILISFEIGLHKPDPEIFKQALATSKFKPEEIAFIDDKEQNLEVAKAAGFGKCVLMSKEKNANYETATKFTDLVQIFS